MVLRQGVEHGLDGPIAVDLKNDTVHIKDFDGPGSHLMQPILQRECRSITECGGRYLVASCRVVDFGGGACILSRTDWSVAHGHHDLTFGRQIDRCAESNAIGRVLLVAQPYKASSDRKAIVTRISFPGS